MKTTTITINIKPVMSPSIGKLQFYQCHGIIYNLSKNVKKFYTQKQINLKSNANNSNFKKGTKTNIYYFSIV